MPAVPFAPLNKSCIVIEPPPLRMLKRESGIIMPEINHIGTTDHGGSGMNNYVPCHVVAVSDGFQVDGVQVNIGEYVCYRRGNDGVPFGIPDFNTGAVMMYRRLSDREIHFKCDTAYALQFWAAAEKAPKEV